MAKKKGAVIKVALKCSACRSHNYITRRNKLNTTEKLVFAKYCRRCRTRTEHKETTKLD